MDELIKQVVAKTGIGEDKARSAIETVVNFLKGKLPESIGGHLDSALGSAGSALGGLDVSNVASSLGGLFGKK
ncbi:MAG: hypothetical protein JNL82_34555 [Myxococcales bacterium]|jgi:hypothetical protein|nr:hypothetical protein [Myxococcales bacterium]